ncbi:MAG: M20 family metallo-hydrolase [Bacteroidota bacterium]
MSIDNITLAVTDLLKKLISTPSFSREEAGTADLIRSFLQHQAIPFHQKGYNIWAVHSSYSPEKPTILLNSHHDTVKPAAGWQRDPFTPNLEGDRLYGLGSNDAGGPLMGLLGAFCILNEKEDLPYNLIFAATAEEEISGKNGVASILGELGKIDLGIVGEPTQMQLAIAEKGLMVLDCVAHGKTGHAAREEGINAIYEAMPDIEWFRTYQFPRVSDTLGPVKMSVTQITAGTQHNVVPPECTFVVDVRTTDAYSNQAAFDIIDAATQCEVKPRSFRLNSSGIALDHPLVQHAQQLGMDTFGSSTLSDQALMSFPTVKIGPGDSARSHTADEYICLSEIEAAIPKYVELLKGNIL